MPSPKVMPFHWFGPLSAEEVKVIGFSTVPTA